MNNNNNNNNNNIIITYFINVFNLLTSNCKFHRKTGTVTFERIFFKSRRKYKYSLLNFSGLSLYLFEKYLRFNCPKNNLIFGKKRCKLQNLFLIRMAGNLNDHRVKEHSTIFDDFKKQITQYTMKIRILLHVTPFRIRIYKKSANQQKLNIHRYENIEFQTVYEEFFCEL
jgi:hypothetical protein